MSLFRAIVRAFIGEAGDPSEVDFVPVKGVPDWRTPDRIDEARRKLGRPFATDTTVRRVTDPSHVLAHINEQTEHARKVRPIGSARRKT
jgi:hypothetical protein